MRTLRVSNGLVAAALLTCGALPSCGGVSDAYDSPQKSSSQAVWGGSGDSNSPGANAVVYISGCTGMLITPRLVLTAAHCFDLGSLPTVEIGNSQSGFGGTNEVVALKALPYPGFNKGNKEAGQPHTLDAQLVWLARPVEQVAIRRPSLTPPADTNRGAIGMAGWSSCGPLTNATIPDPSTRQAVIWHDGVYQSASGPAPLGLTQTYEAGGAAWKREGIDVGTCMGDSGGPLFVEHDDGTREVFGVLSLLWYYEDTKQIVASAWADITQGPLATWVNENALDRAVGGHTPEWLAFHAKNPDTFWFGEADYTGACDTVHDPDCDRWYSEHDDQPDVYDPDQGADLLTPCAGLCLNPNKIATRYFSSGELGTGASCFETTEPLAGMGCSNVQSPRLFSINGAAVDCSHSLSLSEPRNGGYCFQVSAGEPRWASFQTW